MKLGALALHVTIGVAAALIATAVIEVVRERNRLKEPGASGPLGPVVPGYGKA